jgi:hypothetical protein
LARKPQSACTERCPYRKLLLAAQAPRDQQIGDIGASNQEDQRQRREQRIENRAHRSGQQFLVRGGTKSNRFLAVAVRDVGGDGIQFVLRLHDADAGAAWPSASVKVRPSNGCTPSMENELTVTRGATTLCEPSLPSTTLTSSE